MVEVEESQQCGTGGSHPFLKVEATVGTVFRFSLWDGGDVGVLQDPMVGRMREAGGAGRFRR